MTSNESTPRFSDGTASTHAGTISYREAGEGEPLVFVHGFLNDGRLWDAAAAPLAREHRCILPDMPLGSHRIASAPDADLSPPGQARIVVDLLDSLGIERATIVGNDSGGAISQLVATGHPDRVERLVLTNCDAFENFPPKMFAYLGVAAKSAASWNVLVQSMRLHANRISPIAFGRLTNSRIDRDLLEAWCRPAIESPEVRRDARRFTASTDPEQTLQAAEDLAHFERPLLLAWGTDDVFFPLEHARRLAKIVPDSKLIEIPGSRTYVSIDKPAELATAISEFVGQPAPAAG